MESLKTRTLRNKEDILVNGRKYFISSLPALVAQKMLMKAFGALSHGGFSELPMDMVEEMLRYAGTYNQSGAEVQFLDSDMIEMADVPTKDLLEIEARMVEKNFSFFADGSLNHVVEILGRTFSAAKEATPRA